MNTNRICAITLILPVSLALLVCHPVKENQMDWILFQTSYGIHHISNALRIGQLISKSAALDTLIPDWESVWNQLRKVNFIFKAFQLRHFSRNIIILLYLFSKIYSWTNLKKKNEFWIVKFYQLKYRQSFSFGIHNYCVPWMV